MAKRRTKGEGTIFYSEKEARWVAQLTLPDGKKKSKFGKTQTEVRKWLLEQRKAIQDHTFTNVKEITLEKYLVRYMDEVGRHTLKPKTISSYTYIIEKHIKPSLGRLKLTEIRPDHLQKLYSEKIDAGLSKRTVLYTLYLLALAGGFRQGELLGLHWCDIDLNNGTIHVSHVVQELRGVGLVITQPKTDSSLRTVPLPSVAIEAVKKLSTGTADHSGLVFKTSNGTPFSQRNLLRHYHNTLKKLGMPKMRFHALRHTFASMMLSKNVHPKVVQEMLGHSTITLTLDTYSHLLPEIQKDASNKINDLLITDQVVDKAPEEETRQKNDGSTDASKDQQKGDFIETL